MVLCGFGWCLRGGIGTEQQGNSFGEDFVFANQRRHGGKEDRNSDLLIDAEVDPEEIDMAVGGQERDQNDQAAADKGGRTSAIEEGKRIGLSRGNRRIVLCRDRSDAKPKSIH